MPLAVFVAPLLAAVSWAVWVGFGRAVTAARPHRGPVQRLPFASRATLASFGGGFGASGASVRLFGRVSTASELALAAVSGLLVAALVRSIVALAERGGGSRLSE